MPRLYYVQIQPTVDSSENANKISICYCKMKM
jgi:hypothetical protein